MGQQVNVYRKLKMFPGAIVEGAMGQLFDPNNITYYVNNITGSATADGLTWNSAVSDPVYAITLSAAKRAAERTAGVYIMDTIVMQGTSTKYTPITTMPLYTNMIGLGSNPRGQVFGNVRIGSISTANGSSGDEAGNYWYNIQFSAGGSYDAVDLGVSFSSVWDNCTFGCAADNASCDTGISIGIGSGSSWVNCDNIMHQGTPVLGFSTEGTFNDCLIDNCWFLGSTDAVLVAGYLNGGTIFKNSTCRGGTYGIHDTCANATIAAGIFYTNNYCTGTSNGMSITNNAAPRALGNVCVDNTTGVTFTRYSAQAN